MDEPMIRYTIPGKYDVAKFGTICKVMGDNDSFELFIQLSHDDTIGDWKPISYLLEKTFKPFIRHEAFISLCLCLFSVQGDKHEHYKNIAHIIDHHSS